MSLCIKSTKKGNVHRLATFVDCHSRVCCLRSHSFVRTKAAIFIFVALRQAILLLSYSSLLLQSVVRVLLLDRLLGSATLFGNSGFFRFVDGGWLSDYSVLRFWWTFHLDAAKDPRSLKLVRLTRGVARVVNG